MRGWLKRMFFVCAMLPGGAVVPPQNNKKNPFVFIEDELRALKLDPGIAKAWLPGRQVLVFNERAESRAALAQAEGGGPWSDDAPKAYTWNHLDVGAFKDVCTIYIDVGFLKSSQESMNGFGISKLNIHRWSVLHELGHCQEKDENSNRNKSARLARERNADYPATEALKAIPGLVESVILYRSFGAKGDLATHHDTALFLDAIYRRVEIPSVEEVVVANDEAYPVEIKLLSGRTDKRKLSPLAQRRVELFKKALARKKLQR